MYLYTDIYNCVLNVKTACHSLPSTSHTSYMTLQPQVNTHDALATSYVSSFIAIRFLFAQLPVAFSALRTMATTPVTFLATTVMQHLFRVFHVHGYGVAKVNKVSTVALKVRTLYRLL